MLDEYWCGWWWWEPVRMPSYQQHYSNSNWIGMDLQLIEMKLMSSAAEAEDDLKCEEGASLCCCFVNQSRLMIIVKVGTNSVFNNLITQFWMESWSLIIIHVLVTHLVDRRNRCFINRMLLLQFRNQIDGLMTCITSFSWQVPRNSKINWNMLIRSLRYRCNRPTPTDTEVKGRGKGGWLSLNRRHHCRTEWRWFAMARLISRQTPCLTRSYLQIWHTAGTVWRQRTGHSRWMALRINALLIHHTYTPLYIRALYLYI